MPPRVATVVLSTVLLSLGLPAFAQQPPLVLSDEPSRAPFVLVVPSHVVRDHGGLTVVVHDDGAGQRLVFDLGLQGLTVTLRRGEQATELGRAAVALPGTGGAIVLKRLSDGVAVSYDATTVLRRTVALPDGGRWGVVGAPASVLDHLRLQPTDRIAFSDDFMRTADEASLWEDLSGKWRVAQLESARYSANAFTFLGCATGDQPAVTTAGYWFWEDLTVEASVQPSPDATGFGVGLACQPDGDMYLLRYMTGAAPAGVLQLVRLHARSRATAGQASILAQAPAVIGPRDWSRLALSGVDGRLTGALNGVEVLSAPTPELAHGKVALWVAGPRAVAFDDVVVHSGPRETHKPVVLSYEAEKADPGAQAFIRDQYMQEWADERDQWLPDGGSIWHSGHFWGDVALSWELGQGGLRNGVQLHLGVPAAADTAVPPPDATPGCHLDVAAAADGQIALTLREGREVRAQKTVAMPELPVSITLRRVGNAIEALVGDGVAASFITTLPAAGKVGFTAPYALALLRSAGQSGGLSIVTGHVIDSTFRSAPTDWTIGGGDWGVASRWACTPRWSWFQGRSRDLASIWTRRRFTGDAVVEFFAGIPMDQPWAPFYRHPGNLAVTLCGADQTPGSGYSLIFGGWGNTGSGIYRRGELVAQVPGVVMPDIIDSLGGAAGFDNAHKLHNEWRRIRAERIGNTVRLLVDGKLAAKFTDPDPLPGGTVGIWTLDQGITVARARIYYQAGDDVLPPVVAPTLVPTRPAPTTPASGPPRVVSTFEQGLEGWQAAVPASCAVALAEREGQAGVCLQVTNPSAGGRFALAAPLTDLDLRTHPLLAFDVAIPADVRVDVFATVAGQRYRIVLSGPREAAPGIEDVGQIADVSTDGQWHTAHVDLLGLLEPYVSPQRPLLLQALEFAAYAAQEYLRAGIGGNPAGASWRLDNVCLGGVTTGAGNHATSAQVTPARPEVPTLAGLPPARVDCDFETNLGPVEPWGSDAGVALRRASNAAAGNPQGGRWCLEAEATKLGGLYGVSLGVAPFDASRVPVLEFDYRAPRELRVDLIVAVAGSRRTIKFTDNDETWPVIGSVGATADDRWHHAAVDLQSMLASALGRSAPLVVTDLAFASSGWPGTRENMRWWLDNLRLSAALNVKHLPDRLALQSRDESGAAGFAWAVDNSPVTEPPAAVTSADLRAALASHAGSLAWLHAAAVDRAGNRSVAAHIPVRVMASDDTVPPVASAPSPGDGARACPTAVSVKVTDAGAGVSPADLRLTVNGRTWTVADEEMTWETASGQLTWRLPAGVSLGANGARVNCRLEAVDLAGNVAPPLQWAFTVDTAREEQPPAPPVVSYVPALCADSNDFERDKGGWGDFLASQVLRLSRGGATGPGCLELRHIGAHMQQSGFVLVRDFGEEWRRFPRLRFRYRAVHAPYASLQVLGTTFNGAGENWTPLGSFAVSGEEWQTAEVDIAQALARTDPSLDIHRIFLSVIVPLDGALLIDDYAMYSPIATQAGFRWAAPASPSGISGYSWTLDANATTVPPERVCGTGLQTQFTGLKPGRYFFHVRARDAAGKWGPPGHVAIELTEAAGRAP